MPGMAPMHHTCRIQIQNLNEQRDLAFLGWSLCRTQCINISNILAFDTGYVNMVNQDETVETTHPDPIVFHSELVFAQTTTSLEPVQEEPAHTLPYPVPTDSRLCPCHCNNYYYNGYCRGINTTEGKHSFFLCCCIMGGIWLIIYLTWASI